MNMESKNSAQMFAWQEKEKVSVNACFKKLYMKEAKLEYNDIDGNA